MIRYSPQHLFDMLVSVINVHYGTNPADIGCGDGLTKDEADNLREFWASYLADRFELEVANPTTHARQEDEG